jgi:hypothetical protein
VTDSSFQNDEFALRPIETPSREQFERKLEPISVDASPPVSAAKPIRFSLSDIMLVMVGVAIGSAGGNWVPAHVFAGFMGVAAIAAVLLVQYYPPESHFARVSWFAFGLAYAVALGVALHRTVLR